MTRPKKIKMTPQRRVILEELQKTKSHPRADEIYDLVRRRLPRISLGTVYRNLELLSEEGHIMKLKPSASQKRFDGRTEPHNHIRCTRCGRLEDIPLEPILNTEAPLNVFNGFVITGYRLEFLGLCPDCQREENQSPAPEPTGVKGPGVEP